MIKLTKGAKPEYLTEAKIAELTSKFRDKQTSVWNKKPIKAALSKSSNGKCAYCETVVTDPGIYMEVEHFKHKSAFPELVVDWENLLPACKRCNGTKSAKDDLIINPFNDNPKKELQIDHYLIFGTTELGKNSEDVLDLNEEVLMVKRVSIASMAFKTLIEIEKDFNRLASLEARDRKKFKGVLMMTQPSRPYSATVASTIHSKDEYYLIRKRLIDEGLWTNELENLHVTSLEIALPIRSR